ncbi:MAG TPA: energy transducer TonB [Vicinamibacterales bacterium]|nr:energy transducer TonB [Vicinamibacterales bacterium]
MIRTCAVAATLVLSVVAAASAQSMKFTPPRLLTAELSSLPAPNIAGGGEVLIEVTIDRSGALRHPIILRGTPPYVQMVLDAVSLWRFEPARIVGPDGMESTVDMPVTISAVYRPPVLANTPTIGEPVRDWSRPSVEVAYPLSVEMPNYPAQARDGGVVLLEVALNEAGAVTDTRDIVSTGGFESASREALARWRFKGASYRARPVPSTAYVLFGFRPPSPAQLRPPTSAAPFPPNYPPPPAANFPPPPPANYAPPPPPDFSAPPPPNFTAPPPSKP